MLPFLITLLYFLAFTCGAKETYYHLKCARMDLSPSGLQEQLLSLLNATDPFEEFDDESLRQESVCKIQTFIETFALALSNYIHDIEMYIPDTELAAKYISDAKHFVSKSRIISSNFHSVSTVGDFFELLLGMLGYKNLLFFKEIAQPEHLADFYDIFGLGDGGALPRSTFTQIVESSFFKERILSEHEPLFESFLNSARIALSREKYATLHAAATFSYYDFMLRWMPIPQEVDIPKRLTKPNQNHHLIEEFPVRGLQTRLLKIPIELEAKSSVPLCTRISLVRRSQVFLEELESKICPTPRNLFSSRKVRAKVSVYAAYLDSHALFCNDLKTNRMNNDGRNLRKMHILFLLDAIKRRRLEPVLFLLYSIADFEGNVQMKEQRLSTKALEWTVNFLKKNLLARVEPRSLAAQIDKMLALISIRFWSIGSL